MNIICLSVYWPVRMEAPVTLGLYFVLLRSFTI